MKTKSARKGSLSVPGWEPTHGENNRVHKLRTQQVRSIFVSPLSWSELAAKYGCSRTTIDDIRARRTRRRETADLVGEQ